MRSGLMALPLLLCLLFTANLLFAQDKNEKCPVKFGKVTPADFDLSAYKYDSGASAVIIADVGESYLEGNTKGWFSIIYKHVRRVKILNKSGYDAAKEEIPLYSEGNAAEQLQSLKATTYNLENGKVAESRLDDKSIFTDKISKNWIQKKFSFPAVKENSIVEYSYTIQSDYLSNLQPWAFQGEYPCLWSEYTVTIPEYFRYVFLSQGYQPYYIHNTKESYFNSRVTIPGGADKNETVSLSGKSTDYRWVMKDVPPLKDESFTTTLANHIAKIEFQLSQYVFPNREPKDIMGNWFRLSERLMASEYFGQAISKNNGWMDDEIKNLVKGSDSPLEKARKIYAYIRDHFTCTEHTGFYVETPLKTVFKNKSGTESELNILLTAMLNHVHIDADPVILSTRSHGYTSQIYPLQSRFNYVICQASIDSSVYDLDASRPWIGFGHLPSYCYNGHARVINKDHPGPIYFDADALREKKITMVVISKDEKGGMSGAYQSTLGEIESSTLRERIQDKGEKDYFKDVQTSYSQDIQVSNTLIDSLKIPEEPIKVSYDLTYKPTGEEGLIYFNPMLSEAYKTNPFKAADRKYPVEMPYVEDEMYILNMAVPEGYVVDEIPKSTKVLFNDNEGYFEYLVASDGENIQFRTHIKLEKANFEPADYETLRDFYGFIVKKEAEQIVFKKKKQ